MTDTESTSSAADELFQWEEYFEETGSMPADPGLFAHVELSVNVAVKLNSYLELRTDYDEAATVQSEADASTKFWPAKVIEVCGRAIKLRFLGHKTADDDVWLDLASQNGSVRQFQKLTRAADCSLTPPKELESRYGEERLGGLLENLIANDSIVAVPNYVIKWETCLIAVDQIRQGQYVEVQQHQNPLLTWPAKIFESVGGRLLLGYCGLEDQKFWLFYLSDRVHPLGWTTGNDLDCKYGAPSGTKLDETEDVEFFIAKIMPFGVPSRVFEDQTEVQEHSFKENMKLEVLDPKSLVQFFPGTVVEILNNYYFVVEIDDLSTAREVPKLRIACHSASPGIFPPNWCRNNGVRISLPKGYKEPEFQWSAYLRHLEDDSVLAPSSCFDIPKGSNKFRKGLKLEAVNPFSVSHQICAATVSKVIGHLIMLHLDCASSAQTSATNFIVGSLSHEIFPCGWCSVNGCCLNPPRSFVKCFSEIVELGSSYSSAIPSIPEVSTLAFMPEYFLPKRTMSWCPILYFNHRCFNGPFLCKSRIAELPKHVGPGPLQLVLVKALSLLVASAYRPRDVLAELQSDYTNPNHDVISIKAKYRNKRWRGQVEVCRKTEHVAFFCRHVCTLLECCPNLISMNYVIDSRCPDDCHKMHKTRLFIPHKTQSSTTKTSRKTRADADILSQAKERNELCHDPDQSNDGSIRRSRRRPSILMPMVSTNAKVTRSAAATKNNNTSTEMRSEQKNVPMPAVPRSNAVVELKQKMKANRDPSPTEDKPAKVLKKVGIEVIIPEVKGNPLTWTCEELVQYIKLTEAANLAPVLREEQIDGQAFMLLTITTAQAYLRMKLGPAIKLCNIVEKIKLMFLRQHFANVMET